jgi:hypothetical protein
MRRAIEHTIDNPHKLEPHTTSATILFLLQCHHTPYRHEKYTSTPYTHLLLVDKNTFFPLDQHGCLRTPTPFDTKWGVDTYKVCNTLGCPTPPSLSHDTRNTTRYNRAILQHHHSALPYPTCPHPTPTFNYNLNTASIYHSPPFQCSPPSIRILLLHTLLPHTSDLWCDEYRHATVHCRTLYRYSLQTLIRAFPHDGRTNVVTSLLQY